MQRDDCTLEPPADACGEEVPFAPASWHSLRHDAHPSLSNSPLDLQAEDRCRPMQVLVSTSTILTDLRMI